MTIRLNKVSRDLNVGIVTVVEFLQEKGFSLEANPNTKISEEQYAMLVKEFSKDKNLKLKSGKFSYISKFHIIISCKSIVYIVMCFYQETN